MKSEFKKFKLEKNTFYLDGPTHEQKKQGWEMPAKGKILRSDVNLYLEADDHLSAFDLKIAYQQEKVDLLESIIKTISMRGYHARVAADWAKFQVGG
jgi:hypothetical protein